MHSGHSAGRDRIVKQISTNDPRAIRSVHLSVLDRNKGPIPISHLPPGVYRSFEFPGVSGVAGTALGMRAEAGGGRPLSQGNYRNC